jgi:hypothetical protein
LQQRSFASSEIMFESSAARIHEASYPDRLFIFYSKCTIAQPFDIFYRPKKPPSRKTTQYGIRRFPSIDPGLQVLQLKETTFR